MKFARTVLAIVVTIAAFLAILSRPSLATSPSPRAAALEGTLWRLVELHGSPVEERSEGSEAQISLQHDPMRVSGSTGCNRISGPYELSGSSLRFGPLAMTMMACPPDVMKAEQAFSKALDDVRGWKIVGSHLNLLDEHQGVVARFSTSE